MEDELQDLRQQVVQCHMMIRQKEAVVDGLERENRSVRGSLEISQCNY